MNDIKKILGFVILTAVVVGAGYTFFAKKEETKKITYSTSDAKNLKGEITIALDSWIGYFPFKSPVFGQLMRNEGYRVKVIDDNADYPDRMKNLKKGKIDFAVCTVDSYVLNGKAVNYPGAIVTIIDESKGGDAIVAWKNKVSNINQLKDKLSRVNSGEKDSSFKIAFTPSSPSEYLLKSIATHFGISNINEMKDNWSVEVDGAEEAYEKLLDKKVDVAVLWEPYVTESITNSDIVKIIGSEDVEKLIVDILVVNRVFAAKNPDLVKIFLKNYYQAVHLYQSSPAKLKNDIESQLKISKNKIDYMLKGVKWFSFEENINWFGLVSTSHFQPQVIESINSTVDILKESGDFAGNPLPDKDPFTLVNSRFLGDLFQGKELGGVSISSIMDNSLTKRFSKLPEAAWQKMRIVGSLKLRPITFRSGTSVLDDNGREQVKQIVNSIRHYPNYRIMVKGHSGLRGDQKANMELSLNRAKSVMNELHYSYNLDPNRIRVVGVGSKEPLPKGDSESDRGYDNRLKRVELIFLAK